MKLSRKLILAPLAVAVVALAAGSTATLLSHRQNMRQQEVSEAALERTQTLTDVLQQLGELHAGLLRTMAIVESVDEAALNDTARHIDDETAGVQRTLGVLVEQAPDANALQGRLNTISGLLDNYQKQAKRALEMGAVDRNMGVASTGATDATYKTLTTDLRGLVAQMADEQAVADAAFTALQRWRLLGTVAAGLLLTLSVLAWAWRMQRAIAQDLSRASLATSQVATGDLAVEVRSDRRDELGDLLRSVQTMAAQLNSSVRTVQASAGSINSTSAEIASGNLDLSRRTEQTASSLQRTVSAMQQLTAAIQHSADASAQANQLVHSASEVARRGGEVVAQVVATMGEIHGASGRIGDITGTIDSIAFQTNILALNAAVEAARAGESGRGFAVVATEVRALAQRSAQAAREIKTLISASVERVEAGTQLVRDAGATMDEIMASVQRAADITGEISSATSEQSRGVGEINRAVGQLDSMTQQNAALVEQSAAASESLKGQAARLSDVVARFQLQQD